MSERLSDEEIVWASFDHESFFNRLEADPPLQKALHASNIIQPVHEVERTISLPVGAISGFRRSFNASAGLYPTIALNFPLRSGSVRWSIISGASATYYYRIVPLIDASSFAFTSPFFEGGDRDATVQLYAGNGLTPIANSLLLDGAENPIEVPRRGSLVFQRDAVGSTIEMEILVRERWQ